MKLFEGKKTYIAAGLLFTIGFFGLFSKNVDDYFSSSMFVLSFGLVGLAAKIDRYGRSVLDEIRKRNGEAGK